MAKEVWGPCEACGQNLPLVPGLGMCGPCVTGEADTLLDGADLLSEEDAAMMEGRPVDDRPRCAKDGCNNHARKGFDYCGRHAPTPTDLRKRRESRKCCAPGCLNLRRRGKARCRPCEAKRAAQEQKP